MTGCAFDALYYPDRLDVVNPHGDVGLVTLWSPVRTVRRKLAEQVASDLLEPARSRLAVISNLYGDGMHAMFCNLLFNPQVRHLVAVGEDLGLPTTSEVDAFLTDGLEDTKMLDRPLKRIRGTQRLLPALPGFDAARLRRTLSFRHLGRVADGAPRLAGHLDELPPPRPAREQDRVRVEIPAAAGADHAPRPSEPRAHQVVRRRPLDCWEELVVRCVRFGRPVGLADGPRLELRNARALITDPADDPPRALAALGFDLDRFRGYQRAILDPRVPDGIAYTYGNRLRAHFDGRDALAQAIAALTGDRRTRRAYVSLWDSSLDADTDRSAPCLTTLFFRGEDDRLALAATYRAHNLLTAWLQNVYGLMAIQRHVADAVGLPAGPITVLSHSLTIDPRAPRYELARSLAERWRRDDDLDRRSGRYSLRQDPHGYFAVSLDRDRGCIVAEHRFAGVTIKRYEAERAVTIENAVSADMAVSLVSHALWLGRELARHERTLHDG